MKNILSSISQSEKNRILEMHRTVTRKNYLFEQNDVLKAEERLAKFNELIKKGDADLASIYKYRLSYPQGVDSVLDMEITSEDFQTPASKGTKLLTYQEEITQDLTSVIEVYNQAKSLYTDPKLVNKQKFVGTPEQVKNNLSIVDQKINTANTYLTKYNNLLPKLKEIQQQVTNSNLQVRYNKRFIDAGLQKVSEINLGDGTYKTSINNSFLPNGPSMFNDLYILDSNNKWTGYIFYVPEGIAQQGPTPSLEISNKQVNGRTGTIWYKSSQSTNENYHLLNKKINLLESKLESLNRRITRF